MGLVQVSTWAELTGLDATNLGERITLLSLTQDREFANGCRAAILFDAASQGEEAANPAWLAADDLPSARREVCLRLRGGAVGPAVAARS